MLAESAYTISELADRSRVDRRTIVYYIQIGLLPRVGRRGPNTRYPEACLDRLRFIRRLRDLQDRGHLTTITLAEIRRLIDGVEPARLHALVERGFDAPDVEPLRAAAVAPVGPVAGPPVPAIPAASPPAPAPDAAPPALESAPAARPRPLARYGLADAGIRQRFPGGAPAVPGPVAAPPAAAESATAAEPGGDEDLGELFRRLEASASLTRQRVKPGASEQWTEVPVTSRIFLSVRGLTEDDLPLADALGRAMKRLLRRM